MYKTSDQVGSDVPQTHDVTYTSHPASVKVVDGNAIQSTIQGLSTRNNYTFLIQAATLDGSSPFPTIIYVPKQSRGRYLHYRCIYGNEVSLLLIAYISGMNV